jgi:branched-chain amino acid transport system permease protein
VSSYRLRLTAAAALCVVLLAAAPTVLGLFPISLLTEALIYAIFAMSLDIMLGYAGLPSLGHAAFFGAAGYAAALLAIHTHLPLFASYALGALAGGAAAAIFALIALRTRGVYFILISLALAETLQGLVSGWTPVTGGTFGMSVPSYTINPGGGFYEIVLAIAVVSGICMAVFVGSPLGHVLRGIRDNERRASSLGYAVWLYRFIAIVVSGMFAGVAGVLLVMFNSFVSPSNLDVTVSANVFLMVIVGGSGTLIGPAFGAFLITLLQALVSAQTDRWLTVMGIIYVVLALAAPHGLFNAIRKVPLRRILMPLRSSSTTSPSGSVR